MSQSPGPDEAGLLAHPRTFVVRVRRGPLGDVTGVVEAVRTGERQRFQGLEAIGPLIDAMLAGSSDAAPGEAAPA